MAIIDPEGLFNGERLAACSDLAQLYWPRFFLAANGCGRLELTYKSLITRVFGNFQKVPESSEIWQVFREYETNYLAVIYETTNGGWWCQFITSEKFLPRFKTSRDTSSPSPPVETMEKARKGYLEWKKIKSVKNQSFQKFSENFGKFLLGEGVGVGGGGGEVVGVGVGVGESVTGEEKKAQRSVSTQQALSPNGVVPPAVGVFFHHDEAEFVANRVIEETGLTGRWVRDAIVKQAEHEFKSTADTDHPATRDNVSDGMIFNWKLYDGCVQKSRIKLPVTPERFFNDGMWKSADKWGFKKGMTVDGIVV